MLKDFRQWGTGRLPMEFDDIYVDIKYPIAFKKYIIDISVFRIRRYKSGYNYITQILTGYNIYNNDYRPEEKIYRPEYYNMLLGLNITFNSRPDDSLYTNTSKRNDDVPNILPHQRGEKEEFRWYVKGY